MAPTDLTSRSTAKHRRNAEASSQDGFALVCAIWITGLVAVLALTFTLQARTYVALGRNATANAQARAMADAGIMLALQDLTQVRETALPTTSWPLGTRHCQMPDGTRLSITTTDEAGRIDLNTADDPVLLSLLRGIGLGPDRAIELRDKLLDYRDGDGKRRPFGGETQDYVSAGSENGPRNGPLLSVDELGQVLGYDAKTIARLRPYVTVNSGHLGVDPTQASPPLLAMLSNGAQAEPFEPSAPVFGLGLPSGYISVSTRRTFRVRAVASTPSKARFARVATLSLLDTSPRRRLPRDDMQLESRTTLGDNPVKFWSWEQDTVVTNSKLHTTLGTLPSCSSHH